MRRSDGRTLAVGAALVLLAVGCSSPNVELDDEHPAAEMRAPAPVTVEPDPVTVVPEGTAAGVFERPFDGWVGSGSQLTVWWVTGPPPCHVPDAVLVDESDTQVAVTVREGFRELAGDVPADCPASVRTVSVEVVLDAPLGERTVVDAVTGQPVESAPPAGGLTEN